MIVLQLYTTLDAPRAEQCVYYIDLNAPRAMYWALDAPRSGVTSS